MNNTGQIIKIKIIGTKNSQILDCGESSEIIFNPGDPFRKGINDLEDLFSNMVHTAYIRGDAIDAFYVGELDIIKNYIHEKLTENLMNVEDTAIELTSDPIFAHHEYSDLCEKVQLVHDSYTSE